MFSPTKDSSHPQNLSPHEFISNRVLGRVSSSNAARVGSENFDLKHSCMIPTFTLSQSLRSGILCDRAFASLGLARRNRSLHWE